MRKPTVDKGFNSLIDVHTRALEDNSKSLVELLEALSKKKMSNKEKSQLKKINKEIKSIDKRLDSLGKYENIEDEEDDLWA